MSTFSGFGPEAFAFLRDVRAHNSKEWFEAHRAVYDDRLLEPFRHVVQALGASMRGIDECVEIRPGIGKTISSLRRDTRFSRDKTMYRDTMWLTFKRPKKNWTDAPAYFFEIGPDWWRYGLGYYSASPSTMGVFRERLLECPDAFLRAVRAIPTGFDVHGENYKRLVVPETLSEELAPWHVRKSFYIAKRGADMQPLSSPGLPDVLREGFERLSGLYAFLIEVERHKREQGQSPAGALPKG